MSDKRVPADDAGRAPVEDAGQGPAVSGTAPAFRAPMPSIRSRYTAGDRIGGKYRLLRLLGEGGMGAVWVAENEALDAQVALKLIRTGSDGIDMAERLMQEARAAARIGHPGIVRVFDFGRTDEGDPFIVMELLEGEDLAEALESRSRLSAFKSVQLMLPVLHALAAAHHKGIVHRDLKPENVFLVRPGAGRIQPKLVDFGIAKLESNQGASRLTGAGVVLGSPGYTSPEHARGEDVDERADVWGVSVVLYECLTGRSPFRGQNYNALMRSIIEDEPQPTPDLHAGDAELWDILARGLAKNPDERWQTATAMGEALARWLLSHGVRDDISGASLATTWLSVPGEEADLLSSPALGPALADDADRESVLGSVRPASDWTETRASVPAEDEEEDPERRAPRSWVIGLALGALALGGVLWAVLGGAADAADEGPEEPGSSAAAEPPEKESDSPAKAAKGAGAAAAERPEAAAPPVVTPAAPAEGSAETPAAEEAPAALAGPRARPIVRPAPPSPKPPAAEAPKRARSKPANKAPSAAPAKKEEPTPAPPVDDDLKMTF